MKIKQNKAPYVLDHVEYNGQDVAALTRKNADFTEAVVKLDSNYGKDKTQEWFEKMQNGEDFIACLNAVITEIDKTNSTHLEAGIDGRKIMANRILAVCQNVESLKSELSKDFSPENKNHLLYLLTEKTDAKKKETHRYNLSFATKFCCYASTFLGLEEKYSKYDSVVAEKLPVYAEIYLENKLSKGCFKIKHTKTENELEKRLATYAKYKACIDEILAKLKLRNIVISRNELDHIIWYSFK